MRHSALPVCLGLALAASACRPPQDAFFLSITPKPNNRVRDDGTPMQLNLSAVNADETPGRGSVRVQTTAGDLVDGAAAQLDADGRATIDFTCDLALDPG